MEKRKRCCTHCHLSFIPSRNIQQHYCGEQVCQNARKRNWRKHKRRSDGDYRENQQRANKKWQQHRSDYWHQYRESHPNYAQRNREQQRLRDQQRSRKVCKSDAFHLAKSDALPNTKTPLDTVKSGIYRLIPVMRCDLAKSDALTVEISVVTIT